MTARHALRGIMIAALLLALAPARGAESAAAAEQVVDRLHEALLESMQAGPERGFEKRVERLRPVVRESYHFGPITRFVLGRHARELDAGQLAAVADALAELSVRQYAVHFDEHKGERFEHVETTAGGGGRVRVATELVKADGEPVTLEYLLQRHEGEWGVVNVIADGVSDLALKRSEYARLLGSEGYDALMARLREQISETGPE